MPTATQNHAGPQDFPAERFVTIRDVPVFKAHERKLPGGRLLKFRRPELEAIAARGNRRIVETGDYAVVCLGHTKSPGSGQPEPKVIGFSGPFRVEEHNGESVLYADFHVYQQDRADFDRHPRRSPELWLEDKYEDMYLDPIVLLGATAPYLDLGLLYAAERGGRQQVKYAAAAPAAGNCFVPTTKYSGEENAMALSQEDIAQIVGAIEQTDWAQWVKKQMAGRTAAAAETAGSADTAGDETQKAAYAKIAAAAPAGPDKELQAQVVQYAREVADLRTSLDSERAHRVNAQRSERLSGLRMQYAFDLTKEVSRCQYGKLSDEQFAEHCALIGDNYQRIPVGQGLPAWTPAADAAVQAGQDRAQYAKDLADKTLTVCLAKAAAGEKVDYARIRGALERGEKID